MTIIKFLWICLHPIIIHSSNLQMQLFLQTHSNLAILIKSQAEIRLPLHSLNNSNNSKMVSKWIMPNLLILSINPLIHHLTPATHHLIAIKTWLLLSSHHLMLSFSNNSNLTLVTWATAIHLISQITILRATIPSIAICLPQTKHTTAITSNRYHHRAQMVVLMLFHLAMPRKQINLEVMMMMDYLLREGL